MLFKGKIYSLLSLKYLQSVRAGLAACWRQGTIRQLDNVSTIKQKLFSPGSQSGVWTSEVFNGNVTSDNCLALTNGQNNFLTKIVLTYF